MKGEEFRIFRINEDQMQSFYGLIPSDLEDALSFPESYGLAAMTEETLMPAGILLFRLRPGPEEDLVARVDWFYVSEPYRRRGIGTLLTRHLQGLLREADLRETVFEYPDLPENREFTAFLKNRGFLPERVCGLRTQYTLGELEKGFHVGTKKGKASAEVVALCDLPFHEIKNRLKKELFARGKNDVEGLLKREEDYFEPEISCAAKKDGEIKSLLLASKLPSGKIVLWYLTAPESAEGKETSAKASKETTACVETALSTALYAYGKKTEVLCADEVWKEEFASLLEDKGASMMMRAVRWAD